MEPTFKESNSKEWKDTKDCHKMGTNFRNSSYEWRLEKNLSNNFEKEKEMEDI